MGQPEVNNKDANDITIDELAVATIGELRKDGLPALTFMRQSIESAEWAERTPLQKLQRVAQKYGTALVVGVGVGVGGTVALNRYRARQQQVMPETE